MVQTKPAVTELDFLDGNLDIRIAIRVATNIGQETLRKIHWSFGTFSFKLLEEIRKSKLGPEISDGSMEAICRSIEQHIKTTIGVRTECAWEKIGRRPMQWS